MVAVVLRHPSAPESLTESNRLSGARLESHTHTHNDHIIFIFHFGRSFHLCAAAFSHGIVSGLMIMKVNGGNIHLT